METLASPRSVASKAEPSKAQIALVRQILKRVSDAAPEPWVSIAKLKVSQFQTQQDIAMEITLSRGFLIADAGTVKITDEGRKFLKSSRPHKRRMNPFG